MVDILSRLKIRRGTAAQAGAFNPVLAAGELGYVTDTKLLKIGDGATAFSLLQAFVAIPANAIAAATGLLSAVDAAAQRAALGLTSNAIADTVGMVAAFACDTPPPGWVKSNGAALSRIVFPELYGRIGTIWGAGDGVTTFNVPDFRAETMRGWDDGRGIDIGRIFASLQLDAMRNHTHLVSGTTSTDGSHTHTIPRAEGYGPGSSNPPGNSSGGAPFTPTHSTGAAGSHSHSFSATSGNPSVGGGTETRSRNLAVLYCIKY